MESYGQGGVYSFLEGITVMMMMIAVAWVGYGLS